MGYAIGMPLVYLLNLLTQSGLYRVPNAGGVRWLQPAGILRLTLLVYKQLSDHQA